MFVIKEINSELFIGNYWKTGFQLKTIDRAIVFNTKKEADLIVSKYSKQANFIILKKK